HTAVGQAPTRAVAPRVCVSCTVAWRCPGRGVAPLEATRPRVYSPYGQPVSRKQASMTSGRLNRVIEKLVVGDLVVMSPPVMNGSIQDAQRFGDSDYDLVWFEMEHVGFDFLALQASLNAL